MKYQLRLDIFDMSPCQERLETEYRKPFEGNSHRGMMPNLMHHYSTPAADKQSIATITDYNTYYSIA